MKQLPFAQTEVMLYESTYRWVVPQWKAIKVVLFVDKNKDTVHIGPRRYRRKDTTCKIDYLSCMVVLAQKASDDKVRLTYRHEQTMRFIPVGILILSLLATQIFFISFSIYFISLVALRYLQLYLTVRALKLVGLRIN